MTLALGIASVVVPAVAFVHGVSALGEVKGIHDWWVPGAVWRTALPHRVLTFDDGPDPERTPRLLDVLASAQVKAYFFVLGTKAARYPALLRRIRDEGHEVGNHSWSHRWFLPASRHAIAEELDRCQDIIGAVLGTAPRLVRPPYGQRDWRFNQLARERALVPVLWSRNSRDYWGTAAPRLARRLARSRPGEIILMHDGDPLAPHTVDAVKMWLATHPSVGPLFPAA